MSGEAVELDLGWSSTWHAALSIVVIGGGGLALCVVFALGVAGSDPSARAFGVLIGLGMLLLAAFAYLGMRHLGLRLRLDGDGLRLRRRDGVLELPWSEVTRVGLEMEKRLQGRVRYRFYTLTFTLAGPREDLSTWWEGDEYRYALGPAGRAGRRLDRALAAAGARYTGMRDVTA